ncbi:type IV secretion system protein [Variovorax ginsengisoli]|uniref:Type IV secretion system protein VirB5 n=1 Tax=Variovorax ginsengisoli TaxID=363844 RepID=A0ABT9SDH5_9BURK|nr:type IV secretion system protein [Variovorax ginsengisoli]MDP9902412.1 type IV secretion system protein VirB5 [Variovorax ginsengisoli]
MKSVRRNSARLALALSLVTVAWGASAQIPTTDVLVLTQQIQQVQAWAAQYKQMIDQIQTQKQQLESMTGSRGMAHLAPNMLRQELPNDFVSTYDKLRSMGAGGASSAAKAIYESVKTFDCVEKFPYDVAQRRSCEASAMAVPQNIALLNSSVDSAKQRQAQLKGLQSSIDSSDAKAAADLNNRLTLELAYLQNEKMLMDMAVQQQQQQLALTQQRAKEEGTKRLMTGVGGGSNPFGLN